MAGQIRWSPEAVEDVESIAQYISRDSKFYAQATVSKIIDFSHSLIKFPKLGRIVPELNDRKIRERLIYSYRLVYKIDYSILFRNGWDNKSKSSAKENL